MRVRLSENYIKVLSSKCFFGQQRRNIKFMQHVSEREPAIQQFVIVKNKLTSVFYASVLLLIMNFVITLSK